MIIALIIYLTGVVLFWILNPVLVVRKYSSLDISDVVVTLFGSVTSWVGLLVVINEYLGDITLYDKNNKKRKLRSKIH